MVHVQSSCRQKKTCSTLWHPKKTTQRRPAEGALTDRSASSVLQAAAWACTSAERQTQSFISLVTESCETVFLTRRAVRRADGLAYQHSLISLPITRRAWRVVRKHRSFAFLKHTREWNWWNIKERTCFFKISCLDSTVLNS